MAAVQATAGGKNLTAQKNMGDLIANRAGRALSLEDKTADLFGESAKELSDSA